MIVECYEFKSEFGCVRFLLNSTDRNINVSLVDFIRLCLF